MSQKTQEYNPIGKRLTLKNEPSGCISRLYKFTVGNKYEVLDIMGCLFKVKDDEGREVSINQERFSK